MERIEILSAMRHAQSTAWKYKKILLNLYLILFIVEIANFFLPLSLVASIMFGLFGIYWTLVKTKLLLSLHDRTSYAWKSVRPSFDNFISYFSLLLGVVILVLPLIIFPGAFIATHMKILTFKNVLAIDVILGMVLLVLYLRYMFVLPLVVDKNYGPMKALRQSALITKGRLLHLFFLMFIFEFPFFLRMLVSYAYMSTFFQEKLARAVGVQPLYVSLGIQKVVTLGAVVAWFTIVPVAALTFIHVYRLLEPKKR
ncbi:hypothetical protein JW872_01595 [Candidatus Babeliales bacterium]|nr:hypothetical protein [Candidatus Babeliales bacterium]